MDSFIYYLVYGVNRNNRILLMVKVKGYRVNEPRKPAEVRVCNCVHGHQNCKCDGKGNKIR
tara:strand:- start:318 stop:500 length:183 start_codon:yes stop_codon:yes gene_type:complete